MSILSLTDLDLKNDAKQTLIHPNDTYTCQLLDNVDMHLYAAFDQNIPRGSRVLSICTN